MLDTFLPGIGRFRRGHRLGDVPFERNTALAGLVSNREVDVPGQPAIDLDKVRAMLLLLIHDLAPLCFICGNYGIRPNRVWAIDDGAAEVNGWRRIMIGSLRSAPYRSIGRA